MGWADQIFDAQRALSDAEDNLEDSLEEAGFKGYSYITWDGYDLSIEFKKCDDAMVLTAAQQKMLWHQGFYRCWLNHVDESQTYYYREGDVAGYKTARKAA